MIIDDSLKNKELIFDYFMVVGLKHEYTVGNLSLNELKTIKPEILSSFPEINTNDKNDIVNLVKSE
jgi:hypothetical protein